MKTPPEPEIQHRKRNSALLVVAGSLGLLFLTFVFWDHSSIVSVPPDEETARPLAPPPPSTAQTPPEFRSPPLTGETQLVLPQGQALDQRADRNAISNQAFASSEAFLLDLSPLENAGAGDIRGGMHPPDLAKRRVLLSAIDTLIAQPQNDDAVRARALLLLDSLVRQPWPEVHTPEADQFVLRERAGALATLVTTDPRLAAHAYRGIPDPLARQRITTRTIHELVTDGMTRNEAVARVDALGNE